MAEFAQSCNKETLLIALVSYDSKNLKGQWEVVSIYLTVIPDGAVAILLPK